MDDRLGREHCARVSRPVPPPQIAYCLQSWIHQQVLGEQWLGYIYQARLALLQLLQLPENTAIFLEKDDDLDFVDSDGRKSLASLKHKAAGDRLTDLSIDFWKSLRIWLAQYKRDGRSASSLRFFLFTTSTVSEQLKFIVRIRERCAEVNTRPRKISLILGGAGAAQLLRRRIGG